MLDLANAPDNQLWALDLARVELASAFCRRFRTGEITETELSQAIKGVDDCSGSVSFEPLSRTVILEAEKLMRQYGKAEVLRTLDALHVAAAMLIAQSTWVFATADVRQAVVARRAGLKVKFIG